MSEHTLSRDAQSVDLGSGYTLQARNLSGAVRVDGTDGSRSFATDPLDAELAKAGLRLDKVISLPPAPAGVRGFGDGAAASGPEATLNVSVAEDESCVLLVEDTATGALSWVVPDDTLDSRDTVGTRGLPTSLRFTIPLGSLAQAEGVRGFLSISDLGKKVRAFVFKLTDPLLGPVIRGFARKWETKHRPTFTRTFGPDDFQNDSPDFPRLDAAGWRRLAQGRALLFVHGTFSTCGTFSSLEPAVIAELSRRYGGRLFAFNHPTLTADPRENAIAFLSDIPPSLKLEIDIVCHSRGGLVARQIAALGEAQGSVAVRRIVFVGATNAGTLLADDEHMVEMIDRFTTIAKVIPAGAAQKYIDALVLAIKVIGRGFLSDLEGLAAMNPRGTFLKALNVPSALAPDYFAIASDFEPKPNTPFLSLTRLKDVTADRVFENAANDLVVPREGVFARNGATGFPIGESRCLQFGPDDGVVHTEFFAETRTGAKLLDWLEPTTETRTLSAGPSVDELARALDVFRDQALATLRSRGDSREARTRAPSFTPGELEELRPHVVNLSEGVFRQSGIFSTTPADVDAMVREHIPKWAATQPQDAPLRVVIWAHGGLVGERDGLQIARKHIEWWKANGVYPIYFVWETGIFDALRSVLEAVARKIPGLGTRDLFDFTTDPVVQEGVRKLGGVHVWGAMKDNAELASGAEGGARHVARRLAELSADRAPIGDRPLELHAVGHSAGSIFHSWFLPMADDEKLPAFRTLQLLAPAITIPEFEKRLAGPISNSIERTVLYTMKKSFEEDDHCIRVYRKSLLYLIHHGLESDRRTPILGLEISLRSSPGVATLFGLNGATKAKGRVVWSVTEDGDGRSSSRATQHGGFDDDPLTMNSVAAQVLNEPRARVMYTPSPSRAFDDGWPVSDDWLMGIDLSSAGPSPFMGSVSAVPVRPATAGDGAAKPAPAPAPAVSMRPKPAQPASTAAEGGARRALCVGIDAYPGINRLTGCVNDTRIWRQALMTAGFDVMSPLTDRDATHEAIVTSLRDLVTTAKRGDVIVFHFSGHGTQVRDLDGDEEDGQDQAFVPVDFEEGAFLTDDDVREILDMLPAGVNFTAFIDCCHSGTITRILGRNSTDEADRSQARFLKRTDDYEEWMRAHERFRYHHSTTRAAMVGTRNLVDRNAIRWVNFSACDSHEKALEHDGNGDFSRIATRLLSSDISQLTHGAFQDAVLAAFGDRRQQTPQLDCPDAFWAMPLLRPLR